MGGAQGLRRRVGAAPEVKRSSGAREKEGGARDTDAEMCRVESLCLVVVE